MKKIISIVTVGLVMFSFQSPNNVHAIINALKTGSAEELSRYFDNFIDLKLPEKDEIKNMGKNQSSIAIQSFFKENNIKGFDLTSQREMGGTTYVAGKLQNTGKTYNITLLIKTRDGNQQIISVRIN